MTFQKRFPLHALFQGTKTAMWFIYTTPYTMYRSAADPLDLALHLLEARASHDEVAFPDQTGLGGSTGWLLGH